MKTFKLEEIAELLEQNFDDWQQFLNLETGEVVILTNEGWLGLEELEELDRSADIDLPKAYMRLPNQYDINEYKIMSKFAEEISNEEKSRELWRALKGRKPFRRFKDTLNYLGIAQDYYKFRFQEYMEIAKEWCEENQVSYQN